jgi:FKBP-type peptidyl-prolyl cis-trans isomerase SlyD
MGIQVISFRCVLRNKLGQVISSTVNHDVMSSAEHQNEMLSGLVLGLQNLTKGEKRQIELSAKDAYGYYDLLKVFVRRRDEIKGGDVLKAGDQFMLKIASELQRLVRVTEVSEDTVTLDSNHPLAGQDLIFEIEAIDAREATAEEIADSQPPLTLIPLH